MTNREILTMELFYKVKAYLLNKPHILGDQTFVLCPEWQVVLADSKKWAGICSSDDKLIAISRNFINSPKVSGDDILDTILHEFAHALVGNKNGHNNVWKEMCYQIGCSATVSCKFFLEPKDFKYTICCGEGCVFFRNRLQKNFWFSRKCDFHENSFNVIEN